jgi:hypothetical protein
MLAIYERLVTLRAIRFVNSRCAIHPCFEKLTIVNRPIWVVKDPDFVQMLSAELADKSEFRLFKYKLTIAISSAFWELAGILETRLLYSTDAMHVKVFAELAIVFHTIGKLDQTMDSNPIFESRLCLCAVLVKDNPNSMWSRATYLANVRLTLSKLDFSRCCYFWNSSGVNRVLNYCFD